MIRIKCLRTGDTIPEQTVIVPFVKPNAIQIQNVAGLSVDRIIVHGGK